MATRKQILDVLDGRGARFRRDYSGRGMFGERASLAVVTGARPDGPVGIALRNLGLDYDALGLDYVYYSRGSA